MSYYYYLRLFFYFFSSPPNFRDPPAFMSYYMPEAEAHWLTHAHTMVTTTGTRKSSSEWGTPLYIFGFAQVEHMLLPSFFVAKESIQKTKRKKRGIYTWLFSNSCFHFPCISALGHIFVHFWTHQDWRRKRIESTLQIENSHTHTWARQKTFFLKYQQSPCSTFLILFFPMKSISAAVFSLFESTSSFVSYFFKFSSVHISGCTTL